MAPRRQMRGGGRTTARLDAKKPVARILNGVNPNRGNRRLRVVFFAAMLFHLLARDKTIIILIYRAKHAEMTVGKFA